MGGGWWSSDPNPTGDWYRKEDGKKKDGIVGILPSIQLFSHSAFAVREDTQSKAEAMGHELSMEKSNHYVVIEHEGTVHNGKKNISINCSTLPAAVVML